MPPLGTSAKPGIALDSGKTAQLMFQQSNRPPIKEGAAVVAAQKFHCSRLKENRKLSGSLCQNPHVRLFRIGKLYTLGMPFLPLVSPE